MFKLNPQKPEELARYQVPELHYPCWAAPILSEKRLYVRSEDHLICFDLKKSTTSEKRLSSPSGALNPLSFPLLKRATAFYQLQRS